MKLGWHGLLRRLTAPEYKEWDQEALLLNSLMPYDEAANSALLKALYPNALDCSSIQSAVQDHYSWFIKFLEFRFNGLPDEYKQFGVAGSAARTISFADFNGIAIAICQGVVRKKNISLAQLANLTGLVSDGEHDAGRVQQLAFYTVGVMSMLFVPSSSYVEGKLVIDIPLSSSSRRRASQTWVVSELPLGDASGSVSDVLRRFSSPRGPINYLEPLRPRLEELNMLVTSHLNFYTISRLGGIRIQWVDSVCSHLELNRRDKTLMVFRYPSYCALMSYGEECGIFLDRVFTDHFSEIGQNLNTSSPAGDCYREVLLTYRLIFGQDKRSWRLCGREGGTSNNGSDTNFTDPLLHKLCCESWEEEPLYDEIDAPAAQSLYSAQQDFPFFGERLMALQEYTRLLEPHNWKMLYADRRSMNRFCTIWAVIFFSIVTVVVSLLALALAAAQVVGSFKPDGG